MPRFVPTDLLNYFRQPRRSIAHCWAIKPVRGPWEGYTSHNRSLSLPAYDYQAPDISLEVVNVDIDFNNPNLVDTGIDYEVGDIVHLVERERSSGGANRGSSNVPGDNPEDAGLYWTADALGSRRPWQDYDVDPYPEFNDDPATCITIASLAAQGFPATDWSDTTKRPFSLVAVIAPTPPTLGGAIAGSMQVNRELRATVATAGRLYLFINDLRALFGDNYGTLYFTAERLQAGPVSESVPALTYVSSTGVSATQVPTRLNLSNSSTDISVLAFDRGRLLSDYYQGAEFQVFQIAVPHLDYGRDVILSGRIGNAQVDEHLATIEVTTWAGLSEQAQGRTIGPLCDVGIFAGEKFGNCRCRNVTLEDGPLRATWSSNATVTAVNNAHDVTLQYSTTNIDGGALPEAYRRRLMAGDVEWSTGENAGGEFQIKSMSVAGTRKVRVILHQDCAFVPQIGDTAVLVAGCRKTLQDCDFFNNVANFQGFPYLPLKSGVINQKDAGRSS